MNLSHLTILIPTLNECESIGKLIGRLLELYPSVRICVVDDGSYDGTQEIVRNIAAANANISLLDRGAAEEHGITASVISGVENCTTAYFLVMDGDYQHPPETVDELAKAMDSADIVIASRRPYVESQALHRRLFTITATVAAQLSLRVRGIKIQDPMSGYFGGDTALVKQLIVDNRNRFEPKGYKVLFDILRLVEKNIRIQQVKYDFGVRPGGHSKLRAVHGLYFFRSLFR